jgi:hypothetical protein
MWDELHGGSMIHFLMVHGNTPKIWMISLGTDIPRVGGQPALQEQAWMELGYDEIDREDFSE